MSAILEGIVFNDISGNGIYNSSTDTPIRNVYIYMYSQSSATCARVITPVSGLYSFTINTPGVYTLYETVSINRDCPPSTFSQPPTLNVSTTIRSVDVTVTQSDIDTSSIYTNNFGHAYYNPYPNDSVGYSIITGTSNSSLVEVDINNSTIATLDNDVEAIINALGYNTLDNLLYAVDTKSKKIIRIGNIDYKTGILSQIQFSSRETINTGAFDNAGLFYICDWDTNYYYVLNLNNNSKNFLKFLDPMDTSKLANPPYYTKFVAPQGAPYKRVKVGDWALNILDGNLYGVDNLTNKICSINPFTAEFHLYETIGLPNPTEIFGTCYSNANGDISIVSNKTGHLYQISINGNIATATYKFTVEYAILADGAYSINAF